MSALTNLEMPSRAVVRFYNKRGTAEQWIKEGKQAVKMTRLSCHRFRSNEVRLALSLLASNLGNLWRRLALPKRIENWSLTRNLAHFGHDSADRRPLGRPRLKSPFKQRGRGRNGSTMLPVFEVKKEISVKLLLSKIQFTNGRFSCEKWISSC